jgi:hypothetical protein
MNDRENIACQHVLHLIDTFKDTPIIRKIQDYLIVEIFSITLDEYPILCRLLVPRLIKSFSMMAIHMTGEELKKRLPDHVSEIEQERVKYLTLIHSQLTE